LVSIFSTKLADDVINLNETWKRPAASFCAQTKILFSTIWFKFKEMMLGKLCGTAKNSAMALRG